jgi:hypothetical protein
MPTQVEHIVPFNRIGGVTVRVLASSAVDRRFDPRTGQTIKLVFVAFILMPTAKHVAPLHTLF